MAKIGKIIRSFIEDSIREIVTEIYTGSTRQSKQILPPGIDCSPLPDDQGVLISIENNGGKTVQIGVYTDPQTEDGEFRIFSRDDNGAQQAEIFIKKTGIIEINGNADFAVRHIALNTALQTFITSLNALFATKLDGSGAAGALTLDISGAKVDEVKLS